MSIISELEITLRRITLERKFYIKRWKDENLVFSGLKNLDESLSGFNSKNFYCFIARPGNALYTFINTIANNIDILYKTNNLYIFSKDNMNKEYCDFVCNNRKGLSFNLTHENAKKPDVTLGLILLVVDVNGLTTSEIINIQKNSRNWWRFKVLIIFCYIIKDDNADLVYYNEIPKQLNNTMDTIISLYRPKYYETNLNKGNFLHEELNLNVLKGDCEYQKIKLDLDTKYRLVKSTF